MCSGSLCFIFPEKIGLKIMRFLRTRFLFRFFPLSLEVNFFFKCNWGIYICLLLRPTLLEIEQLSFPTILNNTVRVDIWLRIEVFSQCNLPLCVPCLWLVDCVHNFTSFSGRSHLGAYLDALFSLMAFVLQVHEQVKFPEACIASEAKQMKK